MMNTNTMFPDEVDDRIFVQDMNISQVSVFYNYQNNIAEGKYTLASALLKNSDVFFFGSWLLNLLENKAITLGTYLNEISKPCLTIYQGDEPDDAVTGQVWIG